MFGRPTICHGPGSFRSCERASSKCWRPPRSVVAVVLVPEQASRPACPRSAASIRRSLAAACMLREQADRFGERAEVGGRARVDLRLRATTVVHRRLIRHDVGSVRFAHDVGRRFALGRGVVRHVVMSVQRVRSVLRAMPMRHVPLGSACENRATHPLADVDERGILHRGELVAAVASGCGAGSTAIGRHPCRLGRRGSRACRHCCTRLRARSRRQDGAHGRRH